MNSDLSNFMERIHFFPMLDLIKHYGGEEFYQEGKYINFRMPTYTGIIRYHTDRKFVEIADGSERIVDTATFAKVILGKSFPEFLNLMHQAFHVPKVPPFDPEEHYPYSPVSHIKVLDMEKLGTINDNSLKSIDPSLMRGLIYPLQFTSGELKYEGFAFLNDSKGLGICSGSESFRQIGIADNTTIDRKSNRLDLFETMEDYLSLHTLRIRKGVPDPGHNALILFTARMFDGARPYMEKHEQVNLYLSRRWHGDKFLQYAKWINPDLYIDRTKIFGTSISVKHYLEEKIQRENVRNTKRQKLWKPRIP